MGHFTFARGGAFRRAATRRQIRPSVIIDRIRIPITRPPMNRRHHAVSLLQATQDSPTLARLTALSDDSVARLQAIQSLIPAPLRPAVHAGPIEGPVWCLVLDNNAAAAKIRQLLPALQAHLRSKGWALDSIRLKVRIGRGA